MKKTSKKPSRLLFVIGAAVASAILFSSCVPLAAGAAGGYILRDSGHKVQSPITD